MTPSFFDDPEKQALLLAVIAGWQGTPFARFSQAKGPHGGIDCEKYAELVYVEVGVLDAPVEVPHTEADYNLTLHNNRLLDFIRGKAADPRSAGIGARFAELPVREFRFEQRAAEAFGSRKIQMFHERPMIGDLVIGRNETAAVRDHGENLWHIGIMTGPTKFTNCTVLGVREGSIQDITYHRHFCAHFRPRPRLA